MFLYRKHIVRSTFHKELQIPVEFHHLLKRRVQDVSDSNIFWFSQQRM